MFIFCWDNYLLLKTAFSLKLKYWVTSHSDSLGISLRGTHFSSLYSYGKQVLACSVRLFLLHQVGYETACSLCSVSGIHITWGGGGGASLTSPRSLLPQGSVSQLHISVISTSSCLGSSAFQPSSCMAPSPEKAGPHTKTIFLALLGILALEYIKYFKRKEWCLCG